MSQDLLLDKGLYSSTGDQAGFLKKLGGEDTIGVIQEEGEILSIYEPGDDGNQEHNMATRKQGSRFKGSSMVDNVVEVKHLGLRKKVRQKLDNKTSIKIMDSIDSRAYGTVGASEPDMVSIIKLADSKPPLSRKRYGATGNADGRGGSLAKSIETEAKTHKNETGNHKKSKTVADF
jgi:hypothetical protein